MKPPSSSVRRARPLLGTFVAIQAAGADDAAGHRAIDAAFATIEEVQRRMSFHDPASTLSRLNRDAHRQAVVVDEWTFEVLETAALLHQQSGGIFDVSIAPRLQALGFLPGSWESGPASFDDVEFKPGRRVRFRRPDVKLDLGGIAKGFAVDRAVDTLRAAGVPSGLVNAGGDLRAFGERDFPVAIRHPDDPGARLATLALRENSLATSAHTFAGRLVSGATLGAVVDPRTGTQAAQMRSASVRASTAMVADALTKVVLLAGEAALPVLEYFRADAILVASGGEAMCSPRWHAALQFSS